MDKRRFKIGDWVVGQAELIRDRDWKDGARVYARHPRRIFGQIVGIGRAVEGDVIRDTYEGNYFKSWGFRWVWLVREGLQNKSVKVLDEDVGPTMVQVGWKLPLLRVNTTFTKSEICRKEMREIMKDWPRDSSGRWTKEKK